MGSTLRARSLLPFPSLAEPFCPWCDYRCTAMDCEWFRRTPSVEDLEAMRPSSA